MSPEETLLLIVELIFTSIVSVICFTVIYLAILERREMNDS
jgi:hypothetical protein